jgi:hypothetical protein
MSQVFPQGSALAGGPKFGQYYRHSGQINVGGIVAALIAGLIVGAVAAPIYSALVVFVPYVKLRAFGCIFYGLALGAVPAALLKKLSVRNVPISLLIVALITLFSFYISWASWESMVLRDVPDAPTPVTILTHPRVVYNLATVVYDYGTWNLNSNSYDHKNSNDDAVKGPFLASIWALEAAILFCTSLFTAGKMLSDNPFCEKCRQWCGPKLMRTTGMSDVQTLKAKLESGDFASVAALPAPTDGRSLEFTRHRCETCKELNTLSVATRFVRKDKKGRVRVNKKKMFINKLLISADDVKKLIPSESNIAVAPATVAPLPIAVQQAPSAAPVRKPIKSPQAL